MELVRGFSVLSFYLDTSALFGHFNFNTIIYHDLKFKKQRPLASTHREKHKGGVMGAITAPIWVKLGHNC